MMIKCKPQLIRELPFFAYSPKGVSDNVSYVQLGAGDRCYGSSEVVDK